MDSAGANNTAKTGDRCWATDAARTNDRKWDNATLSLPGHSGELVRVGNTTQWRLKTDDGTRVEKIGTPGASGEKWKVTTTGGTQCFFGASSTAGVSATNAVWTLPVAGNHAGEPGYNAAFASSFTTVPWRWNLDYVVSINGDSMTYLYNAETNKYKQNKTTVVSYTRGGYLKEIRYGERAGAETTSPPAKVTFTVAERCFNDTALTACATATPTAATAYHWPDVPVDAICTGDTCTATQISPTFFTRKKLTQLNTYVTIGTTLTNVDRWTFGSGFPNPGDASSPALWLQTITHAGVSSGTITLPTVTLTPTMKPNRIAGATSGTPITRPRLGTITTESGGKTTVTYTGSDCTATSLPTPETNTRACFPALSSEGTSTPTLQWFHLYRVSQVLQQDTAQVVDPSNAVSAAGAVGTRTTYSYAGGGAWRYDDSILTPAKYRTWGIWRGYATTTTVTGDPGLAAQPQQVTQTTYFRGMNGDRLNSGGGTRTVVVTDSTGATWPDDDHLAGTVRETRRLTAASGGTEISGTVEDPWQQATTSDGRTQVKLVGTAETRTRQTISTGVRTTRITILKRTSEGRPTLTQETGDEAWTGDETCTRTSYAADNTGAWLIGLVAEQTVMPAPCATAYSHAAAISGVRHYYDGTARAAMATLGRETRTDRLTSTATTRGWTTTAKAGYDAHGRQTSSTNTLGRASTTRYTPATGSPVTQVAATTADPDGTGALTAHTTTSTLDPRWGTVVKLVQPGGQTSETELDALGRPTRTWPPGQPRTANPSAKYAYTVNAKGVNAVKTETLRADGVSYGVGYTIYDSLLRERQTQSQSADGSGRVIRDTRYDSRGLAAWTTLYLGTGEPAATLVQPTALTSIPSSRTTVSTPPGGWRAPTWRSTAGSAGPPPPPTPATW